MAAPDRQGSAPPRSGYISLPAESGALSPATSVAGLPLLVRLARQLTRLDVTRLVLVSPGSTASWQAVLKRYGVVLPVDAVVPEAVPDDATVLDAMALYDADSLEQAVQGGSGEPSPRIRIADRASLAEAEAWLWGSIRKSMSHDGPVAYYLARPLSNRISRLLLPTGVSPNAVTLFGLGVGLLGGGVAAMGGYGSVLAATLLFYLGMILDCVDGDLARIQLATSRRGQWLDSLTDDLSVVFLTLGMGIGLWRSAAEPLYLWAGLGGAGLVVVGQTVIYAVLLRGGGPIDTAKYPWFFSGDDGLAQQGQRSLVGYLSFLFRRDCQTLAYVLLAAVGQGGVILALLAGGGAIYFVLLLVDRLIKAIRPGETRA